MNTGRGSTAGGAFAALRQALYKGFVSPFVETRLKGLLITTIVFCFGFSMFEMFVILDFGTADLSRAVRWMLWQYLFTATLIPFLVVALRRMRAGPQALTLSATLLLSPLILLVFGSSAPFFCAAVYALAISPFWVMYHLAMTAESTDENRGNEVSMAMMGSNIGMMSGAVCGGALVWFGLPQAVMTGAGISILVASTFFMMAYYLRLKIPQALQKLPGAGLTVWQGLFRDPHLSVLTVLEAMFYIVSFGAWPLFLAAMGLTALAAGAVQSLGILIRFVFSPLVGHLVNKGQGHETFTGALMRLTGWVPWALVTSPVLIPFSILSWNIGAHFFGTGLMAEWYKTRAASSIASREICLGIGRILGVGLFVPLIALSPGLYIWAGIGVSALTLLALPATRKRIASRLAGAPKAAE